MIANNLPLKEGDIEQGEALKVSALVSDIDPDEKNSKEKSADNSKPKNKILNPRKQSQSNSEATKAARVIPSAPEKKKPEDEFGKMIMNYAKEADKVYVKQLKNNVTKERKRKEKIELKHKAPQAQAPAPAQSSVVLAPSTFLEDLSAPSKNQVTAMHVPFTIPRINDRKIFEKKPVVVDSEFNFNPAGMKEEEELDHGAMRLKKRQQKHIQLGKMILEDNKGRLNAAPLPL